MSVKVASIKSPAPHSSEGHLKVTNFAIFLCHIVFPDSQLHCLSLMLIILGSGGGLLPFLSTIMKSQHKMKGRLLLSVVVG
jgi:hypothetical protein